ncbi:MAG: competence/damage-inducible protein A [Saccharofermentanales bacterium]
MEKSDESKTELINGHENINSIEILSVGTELLMGQIVNTNAAFLAGELTKIGIPSYYQTVVGDNKDRLESTIRRILDRSDAVIMTGGLGPTSDDITMEVAAKSVGLPLEFHQESADMIRSYFNKMHREMAESNLKQAMLPAGCIILVNNNGTAPGAVIESGRKTLIMLPGPPNEMRHMFNDSVKPYLERRAPVKILSRFVRLFGIGESQAESMVKDLIDNQTNPTIAPYCSEGECMFRVSYTQDHVSNAADEQVLTGLLNIVKDRFGDFIYEIGERNMPGVVFDLLSRSGKTVSFAESCTAGLATSMLAGIPGASKVLNGGVVAYRNDIKENVLGVPAGILAEHGAVSGETAESMAAGCRRIMHSDYAVSITGIAGPDGGTQEKPVGLVYLCLAGPGGVKGRELHLTGNRSRIRNIAALNAFDLLRRALLDDSK